MNVANYGGFFVGSNGLFLTANHVLDKKLGQHEMYAILLEVPDEPERFNLYRILDFIPDSNGLDLAIGTIDFKNKSYLPIARNKQHLGASIYSYGFPLTEGERRHDNSFEWRLLPRYFQGYLTRNLLFSQPGYKSTPSYEVNFPAPSGLSGAPLLIQGTKTVCGVIYGNFESSTILDQQEKRHSGKTVYSETRRVVEFGLAHYHSSLLNLRYSTFGKRTLGEMQL